jgi:short-subunit dehydrogenase
MDHFWGQVSLSRSPFLIPLIIFSNRLSQLDFKANSYSIFLEYSCNQKTQIMKRTNIMKKFILILMAVLTIQMNAQDIIGDWHGVLSYQGTELRIVFHVKSQDGKYQSTMDSPDQGATGIPMEETTFEDGKLHIVAQALNIEYNAELSEEKDKLKGSFEQNGMSWELIMTREQAESQAEVQSQEQKVILITGTASGIGKASAEALIEKGHIVYGGDIQVEKNLYLNDIGGHALNMDVTKDDQVNGGVQKVLNEQGRIDVLINNAGYGSFATIENIDMDELQYQFQVNVFGYARLQQAVLPHMRKQRSGLIIEMSSVVGEISTPMLGWYAATKHAVEAMADALRQEVSPFGIDVVKIQPGAVKSNFPNVALAKLDKSYIPEDYKQLAADFKLVVEGSYTYNAESTDGTVNYIIQAVEAEDPETEYRTTLSSQMAIQTKIGMDERLHDQLNSSQFQQAVNYLRRIKAAEKNKEEGAARKITP